jgi:hypothetical protein
VIQLLQSPNLFCVHNVGTEYGFMSGIVFVKDGYQSPCQVIDLETKTKYRVTSDLAPGIYYQQEIYALPFQESNK